MTHQRLTFSDRLVMSWGAGKNVTITTTTTNVLTKPSVKEKKKK